MTSCGVSCQCFREKATRVHYFGAASSPNLQMFLSQSECLHNMITVMSKHNLWMEVSCKMGVYDLTRHNTTTTIPSNLGPCAMCLGINCEGAP